MKDEKIFNTLFIVSSYIATMYLSLHASSIYYADKNKDVMAVFNKFMDSIDKGPGSIIFNITTLKFTLIMVFALTLFWVYFKITKKTYMEGKECGSAKWSTKEDIKKLMDKEFDNNIILTNTEMLSLDCRKTRKNLNTVVIGGSGSGKTRYVVKPNLMQLNTSYVVTDPKCELLKSTGDMFEKAGYKIKILNLIEMQHSNTYNPFSYLREDKDILRMINNLIKNTTPKGQRSGDGFWEKSETALLQALCYYLYYEAPDEEKNFTMVMDMIEHADVKEDDENHESNLDILFKQLEIRKPTHVAVKQYKVFKKAAGKTAKSILISVGVRLAVFNTEAIRKLTEVDNINLGSIGDEKTILYIIIPDSDDTYNFLVAMIYSQIFDTLYYKADFEYNGSLPVHVRLVLDEFCNIGKIPDFEKVISTVRSREMSVTLIIQGLSQLKSMYEKSWETITANCDSLIFLGGNEQSTLEYMSKALGKQTINYKSYGRTRGKQGSSSTNFNIKSRELMTSDEIAQIPDNKCILLIKGLRPFYSDKFVLENHKRYPELGEDVVNIFDNRKIMTGKDESENDSDGGYEFIPEDVAFDVDNLEFLEYEVEFEGN